MEILITNGLVITVDKEEKIIEDGAIYVEGNRIADVGRTTELRKKYPSTQEVIDASGQIVMPGFFTSHSHLYGVLLRSIPPDKMPAITATITDFLQILHSFWWPLDESLTYDFIYASALAGAIEYVKVGVTCLADTLSAPKAIENSLDRQDKALNKVGIRAITAFEPTERHSRDECESGIKENVRFIEKTSKDKDRRVKGMMCLHASFTVTDWTLKKVRELASKYKVPIHMHAHEGPNDLYHNYERYGKRPMERLRDVGFLGPDVCLGHCIQCIYDPDIKILKETGTSVAHDPLPNLLEGAGLAPVPDMLREGVTVGLGDDGYVLDPFQNMRVFMSSHAGFRRSPGLITADEALELYTMGSSKCFGMDSVIGSIEVGKKADIIMIKPPVGTIPLSASNIVDYVVNFIDGKDVQTTIIDGKIVMKDKALLTVNEEKAYELCRREVTKLWDRVASAKPQLDFLKM